jgi:PPK2 family polyphosphate:nucleotide phosphotransferase
MKQPFEIHGEIRLREFDPSFCDGMDKDEACKKTAKFCKQIGDFQELLYANSKHALLILFQGMDASGKDGAAKRVLECVNPAGVETANFKQPSLEERAHDFLWRAHKAVPRLGNIGVFNRSHYEDVLIVRVLGLQPAAVWRQRYDQINAFERILTLNGVVLLKFFLHISKEEQAERFRARLEDPAKNWKFSEQDLKIRQHWNGFQRAYEEAVNRCSTEYAPWHIVPADRKWYRDYVVARTVAHALENLRMKWPKPVEDLSGIKIR